MDSFSHITQTRLAQQQQQLETTFQRPSHLATYQAPSLGQWLRQLGQVLVNGLTRGDAPRITRIVRGDRELWQVYDPMDNLHHVFEQEDEVRAWLDQRYYSSSHLG